MKNTTKTNLLFYMLLPTIIIIIGVAVVTAETQTTIEDSNLFTFRTTAASGTQMIIPRITYLQGGDQSFYPYSQSGYILKPATYSGCSIQQICPSDTSHGPTCDDGESCGICLTYRDSETCDQGVTCEGSGYQTCEGTCIDATCTPICDETNNGFYTCDGTSNTCDGTDTCDGSPIDPHTCYGHTCHYTCVPGLTCEGIPDCNHTETWELQ